jgi:hypothetical protein
LTSELVTERNANLTLSESVAHLASQNAALAILNETEVDQVLKFNLLSLSAMV